MFDHMWSFLVITVVVLITAFIYFIPYLVASYRRSNNIFLVFIINLFFGWSLIGWIVALILAFMGESQPIGQCPYCLTYINPKARKCPNCCEWLDNTNKYPLTETKAATETVVPGATSATVDSAEPAVVHETDKTIKIENR